MKKYILFGLVLISLTLSGCIIVDKTCVYCDIYNDFGDWVKDYGEYCGTRHKAEDYAQDADQHARKYYDGYAICEFY